MSDPFAPLAGGAGKAAKAKKSPAFVPIVPVPTDAAPPPRRHPKMGEPAATWTYRDAGGAVLGYAYRFNLAEREKAFRPLVLFSAATGGRPAWRWEAWPAPRPLYGLDRLAARPHAPVVLCEGEKAADAASLLLPDHVAITSPNGSNSADKADWSPLAGRHLVIWPDHDAAGLAYAQAAETLALAAGAASVARIELPADIGVEGWDAADALAEAWSSDRARQLVGSARPRSVPRLHTVSPKAQAGDGGEGKRRRAPPQRDSLMSLTETCDLWHGSDGECYATFSVGAHREAWPIRSRQFKRWLSAQAYEHLDLVPGAQAVEDTLRILEARAASEGPECDPWMRTGYRDGKLYLDLCDRAWRAIEISPKGWRIVERHGLPFVRSGSMQALPLPEQGDACAIEELRPFVNTETDEDFVLVVAWLLAAMRNRGPYPVLILNGQQGTGKSNLSKLIRSLVDPNAAPIRAAPRDDRDLIVAAVNAHCLVIDNMSAVPAWLADGLCRLATGGGFSARALHTDRDEMTFMATRPILLNGIPSLVDRADLADRAVTVRLRPISEDERRPEDEMAEEWEAVRPRILAALCDALSTALRRLPETKLVKAPRLADFAKWISAAEPGLGWAPGTFMAAYGTNRRDVVDSAFEASPVAMALHALAHERRLWTGTATQLLGVLGDLVTPQTKLLKLWPQTAQGIGNIIDRVAPLLKGKGVIVEKKHSETRTITVALMGN
jgi:putative DNA primase/helicase